jgi:DUF4097 and DUF4098 domain-containing protein YvlB
MKRNIAITTLAVIIAVLIPAVLASGQDFHKTYAIASGGHISIKNISGDIKVTGYSTGSIEVIATKVGRDRDLIQVEDLSSGDKIEIGVKYPEHCNCDASVNFDVRVPAGVEYSYDHLASVSGDVDATSVRGRLSAKSVSGNVTVSDVTGIVSASSVSGDVNAQITRLEGEGEMKFSSVSGNVQVKAPGNPNADIEMSSVSGTLDTDFPIEVQKASYGPGRSARGRIGTAANTLKLSTVSGKVSLTKM